MNRLARTAAALLVCTGAYCQQPAHTALDPAVVEVVRNVSEFRMAATMKRLERFGTRNVFSAQDDPRRGIGAAERWLVDELKSYSPRLQVSTDTVHVKKAGRVIRDVDLHNVIAVLPGTADRSTHVLVTGHYDSLVIVTKPGMTADQEGSRDDEASANAPFAPGVTDDASGTAAVLELARVLSQHEWEKTLVFIAFSGEEIGLEGARGYARRAKAEKVKIEAVLNNDIIGTAVGGNGVGETNTVRVFSGGPADSPSRSLARYVKEVGERYVPEMKVGLVYRDDRFQRGGDQTPFHVAGFGAVRFTSAVENYAEQHTIEDTFANTNVHFAANVARVNAAVAASLALAPHAPDTTRELTAGPFNGRRIASLTRGKSHYDAVLRWTYGDAEPDLAGFAIVVRSTLSPYWEKEIYVGDVREYTMRDVSIDDVVFGVRAIDKAGHAGLVSAYVVTNLFAQPAAPAPQPSKPTN